MFSFQLNQLIIVVSFFLTFFTTKFNTSSIESISSISIFSVLKSHFELCYRFNFFDFLNLLIMKCIKNVIDFQQILKFWLYKKTINDSSRKKWLKILKNEKKKFWSMKSERWSIFLKIDKYFVINEFTRSKKKHDEIMR
jgi:hypothetical protein